MEALLLAHDSIISYVDGLQRKQSPSSSSPSGPPSPTSSWRGSRVVDNIKIIRIEKTNEPLGATVRNEGDAVIIGILVSFSDKIVRKPRTKVNNTVCGYFIRRGCDVMLNVDVRNTLVKRMTLMDTV